MTISTAKLVATQRNTKIKLAFFLNRTVNLLLILIIPPLFPMTLTIDFGNTRAKLTLFSAQTTARTTENSTAQTAILEHHSVTHQHLVAQLQQMLEQHPNIQRICWCAVGAVPTALTQFWKSHLATYSNFFPLLLLLASPLAIARPKHWEPIA